MTGLKKCRLPDLQYNKKVTGSTTPSTLDFSVDRDTLSDFILILLRINTRANRVNN